MLTEHQIEIAARDLCRQSQIDPDRVVEYDGHNLGVAGMREWQLKAPKVREHACILDAIERAQRAHPVQTRANDPGPDFRPYGNPDDGSQ